jgi:hypothetical protein
MWLRPWHVIICVVALAVVLVTCAYVAGNPTKDILLGLGVNLLSSVVFFVLLELYWQKMKQANGKEVGGLDYLMFARNISRSRRARVLATFIYPFTDHPRHRIDRQALLQALQAAVCKPSFLGAQMLFLHPESPAARSRAAERKDDDVLRRMAESLSTLQALMKQLDSDGLQGRIEVRLFWRTPPFALFQADNFASISFYFRDQPISEVTRYEFFMDSPLGVFVEKTFDDLWRDERTIVLGDYHGPPPPTSATT